MSFLLEKAKNSKAKRVAYAAGTTPGRWSDSTPRPIWRSVGAVLRLLLEINLKGGYHGLIVLRGPDATRVTPCVQTL
jgi:hypothetical protein